MQAKLEAELGDGIDRHQRQRVVCRTGDPTLASELRRINIRAARTIVAIGSDAPTADETVTTTVLAVGVACGGFGQPTLVAQIDDALAATVLSEAATVEWPS
jgi:hypothetical protein